MWRCFVSSSNRTPLVAHQIQLKTKKLVHIPTDSLVVCPFLLVDGPGCFQQKRAQAKTSIWPPGCRLTVWQVLRKRPQILLSAYSSIVCVTFYLLLSSTCPRKRGHSNPVSSYSQQYWTLAMPSHPWVKPEQSVTSRPFLGVFNLLLILLLAGDVELNPGPQSVNTHFLDALQSQLTGLNLDPQLAGLHPHQP